LRIPPSLRAPLLKSVGGNARLNRLDSTAPIRSSAAEESDFQIPLWSVPLIFAVLYVCLFSGLGAFGLVGPDEPRYAAIARAMSETHDWVTPRLWGTPWFEKPVLYYWAAGAAMRIFGVSEFAARLPSALAALLAVLAIAWTALRSYGVSAAWYSLLMLPTSVAMIGFSRAAGPDMLFAGLLAATMAVASEMLEKSRPGTILRIAFGFFLGAAVLAKGPAAVILAGGGTLLWAVLSHQWRAPFRFLHPLIIIVFCATALPWYALCALRNPDFLHVFIWQHNFQRYLTPVFEHRQPFWFFGPILLAAILPWILLLIPALARVAHRMKTRTAAGSPSAFFACWSIFPIVFFSLSQSKLPGYILPAIPPLLLLLARWVSISIDGKSQAALRVLGWTGVLFLPLAVPLFLQIAGRGMDVFPREYFLLGVVVFVLGLLTVIFTLKKRPREAFVFIVVLIACSVEIANFKVLPDLDATISSRPLARELLKVNPAGDDVGTYDIPRAWRYGLDFYLNRDLPEWTPASNSTNWVAGNIAVEPEFENRYRVQLDEIAEANKFRVCLYQKK
jgi:4-amino-4-deoxy-L-arabinose transferase-like glycosyltransferase